MPTGVGYETECRSDKYCIGKIRLRERGGLQDLAAKPKIHQVKISITAQNMGQEGVTGKYRSSRSAAAEETADAAAHATSGLSSGLIYMFISCGQYSTSNLDPRRQPSPTVCE